MEAATMLYARLRQNARENPGKAGVLIVLVLIMAALWAKMLVKPQPASASASPAAPSANVSSDSLTPSNKSSKAAAVSRRDWLQSPLPSISRNLFIINYDRYYQANSSSQNSAEQAKLASAVTDQKKQRQILVSNLQQQAGQLKLQSIVMGAKPKALIDGRLVAEGDSVASFHIIKITARGIVMDRDGVRLEVLMK